MAQAHHGGLLAKQQDLNKQIDKGFKISVLEVTDPAMVRLLITS